MLQLLPHAMNAGLVYTHIGLVYMHIALQNQIVGLGVRHVVPLTLCLHASPKHMLKHWNLVTTKSVCVTRL